MKDSTNDDVDQWAARERQRAGWRLIGVGSLVLVPCLIWLLAYLNWDSDASITRVKVVGGVGSAIGAMIALAGVLTLVHRPQR